MQNTRCPTCGYETIPDAGCPVCTQANGNGKAARPKPPLPPELAGRVFTRTPPEMAEEIRRTFNEEESLAAIRDLERTAGVSFEEIMAEIDRKLDGRN
jgi:hypothetical protein